MPQQKFGFRAADACSNVDHPAVCWICDPKKELLKRSLTNIMMCDLRGAKALAQSPLHRQNPWPEPMRSQPRRSAAFLHASPSCHLDDVFSGYGWPTSKLVPLDPSGETLHPCRARPGGWDEQGEAEAPPSCGRRLPRRPESTEALIGHAEARI